MDQRASEERGGQPAWAAPQEGDNQQAAFDRTPPPPPGAELEPGEQSASTVREEQQTGETTGYNERGITANDAEMGVQPRAAQQQPYAQQEGQQRPGAGSSTFDSGAETGAAAGMAGAAGGQFQERWRDIQGSFVDDPRSAVEQADRFFDELIQRLSEERRRMREQWDRGDQTSTEDLRVAMQRYRDYFQSQMR